MKKVSIIINFTLIPLLILIMSSIYNVVFSLINVGILVVYGIVLLMGRITKKFVNYNYIFLCKFKVCFFSMCLLIIFVLPLLLNIKSSILVIGYSLWPLVLISILGIILNYKNLKK